MTITTSEGIVKADTLSVSIYFPPKVSVLVMCHTRELAFQISKEYERFSKYMPNVKVSQGKETWDSLRVWGAGDS